MPPSIKPTANITSPELFAEVSGAVKIIGTASGENFSYYRVQVGKGLNPQTWTQLGSDVITPVENGQLAEWDTTGLSGLYAVQLQVVQVRSNCGYGGDLGNGEVTKTSEVSHSLR